MHCILFVAFLLALLESTMAAAPADLNCTEYTDRAVNCNDKFSSATCLVIYTAAVKVGTSDERNAKCFQNAANQRDEEVVQVAVQTCPKTCGYCCITPAYNCKNKDAPRVKCETVTKAQCDDPTWKAILAEDCPAVCGLCEQKNPNCRDKVASCKNDVSICRNVDLQDFVRPSDESYSNRLRINGGGDVIFNEIIRWNIMLFGLLKARQFIDWQNNHKSHAELSVNDFPSLGELPGNLLNVLKTTPRFLKNSKEVGFYNLIVNVAASKTTTIRSKESSTWAAGKPLIGRLNI
uniref:ShKT domain-containing protein n=1 Tax=Angiostrongylus costaricensis TaxID=334426 RepID=A0A0R3PZ18_ANGCS